LFTFQGRIPYGGLSRTSLFLIKRVSLSISNIYLYFFDILFYF